MHKVSSLVFSIAQLVKRGIRRTIFASIYLLKTGLRILDDKGEVGTWRWFEASRNAITYRGGSETKNFTITQLGELLVAANEFRRKTWPCTSAVIIRVTPHSCGPSPASKYSNKKQLLNYGNLKLREHRYIASKCKCWPCGMKDGWKAPFFLFF